MFKDLVHEVMEKSSSDKWEDAAAEWHISGCNDREYPDGVCLCGKENIRWEYTLRNDVTGETIFPVGSVCIKKFGNEVLSDEVDCWKMTYKMVDAAAKKGRNEKISLFDDKGLFSRKLIGFFYDNEVFLPNKFNGYCGSHDADFMTKMFNKRSEPTEKQRAKADAIVENQIYPFLRWAWKRRTEEESEDFDPGSTISSIQTNWHGVSFRSRLEARWAVVFECMGIDWEYEPQGFLLDGSIKYLPDFLLHGVSGENGTFTRSQSCLGMKDAPGDVYVEVKGRMTDKDLEKCRKFYRHHPLYVVGEIPRAEHYSHSELLKPYLRYFDHVYYDRHFIDGTCGGLSLFLHDQRMPWLVSGPKCEIGNKITDIIYNFASSLRFDHGDVPDDDYVSRMRNTNITLRRRAYG